MFLVEEVVQEVLETCVNNNFLEFEKWKKKQPLALSPLQQLLPLC